jgi:hypothetical protein
MQQPASLETRLRVFSLSQKKFNDWSDQSRTTVSRLSDPRISGPSHHCLTAKCQMNEALEHNMNIW